MGRDFYFSHLCAIHYAPQRFAIDIEDAGSSLFIAIGMSKDDPGGRPSGHMSRARA